MSRYGKSDWDDLLWELHEFLKEHTVSELLTIVQGAVEDKEQGYI